jgi:hypothetical protein
MLSFFNRPIVDYIKCIDIDHASEKRDKFLDFSLAIKPFDSDIVMHSLSECIESYLKPELLDGDNMVFVESVEKKVPAIKGLKIGKLPYIMSVHLKRFVFDFSGPSIVQKKLNDQVRFPMVLDMNKYVAGRTKARSTALEGGAMQRLDSYEKNDFELFLADQIKSLRSGGNAASDRAIDMMDPSVPDLVDVNGNLSPDQMLENEEVFAETVQLTEEDIKKLVVTKGEWIYELYAVLIHSGVSSGGHYYAYIKDSSDDTWWNFNDSSVTQINKDQVFEAWGGKAAAKSKYSFSSVSMSNAYMLTYRKVNIDGKRQEFPLENDIPLHVKVLASYTLLLPLCVLIMLCRVWWSSMSGRSLRA